MDLKEAIEVLNRNKPTSDPRLCGKELCTACEVAISAMQKLNEYEQKLRELYGECDGMIETVIDSLIKYNKILGIKTPVKARLLTDEDVDLWDEYKKLGTLEEVQEAVEKQKEKTPTYEGDGYAPDGTFVWDEWLCPNCGERYEVDYDDYDYCPNCGQRILWEE